MSPEPAPPATVEKRTNTGVFFFGFWRNAALVRLPSGRYGWKKPWAPDPRACTIRSGIRSWSKWVIFSRKTRSSSSVGPRVPARSEFWLSEIGNPWLVVSVWSALLVV